MNSERSNIMSIETIDTSLFLKDIRETRSIWVARSGSHFLIIESAEGTCLPVWSTRERLVSFLESSSNNDKSPLEIPVNLFLVIWWPEIQRLCSDIGINWRGKGDSECMVKHEEFEVLMGEIHN